MSACTAIETSALLTIVEQAGMAVATLIEGLERGELLRSRLTRTEVLRQLQALAASAAAVAADTRAAMPEIDWAGWEAMGRKLLLPPGDTLDEALWFAGESLVPATLLWLRVHRKDRAALFQMTF